MEQYTLATPGCTPPHNGSHDTSNSKSGHDVNALIACITTSHAVLVLHYEVHTQLDKRLWLLILLIAVDQQLKQEACDTSQQ